MVPVFTCHRSTGEASSFTPVAPASTPQTFPAGCPHRKQSDLDGRRVTHLLRRAPHIRPKSARLEPVPHNEASDTGFSRIPSRLAHQARTVWQYRHDLTSSGLLPPTPGTSQGQAALSFTRLLRQPGAGGLSPPFGKQAPHGAPAPHDAHRTSSQADHTPETHTPHPGRPAPCGSPG